MGRSASTTAIEPRRWRDARCAGRDTRVETVVYENQLGTKSIPANVTGGFALKGGIPSDGYDKFSVMPPRGIDEYSHCQITEQINSAVRFLVTSTSSHRETCKARHRAHTALLSSELAVAGWGSQLWHCRSFLPRPASSSLCQSRRKSAPAS